MKIVVLVKQVATLDDEFELVDGGVPGDFLDWSLNEWDEFSLEAALQLRESAGDGEVVVMTVAAHELEDGLLACLAKGADRAVRIWDSVLEGADALAVARVLAEALRREAPQLVLAGAQSSDAANSATGIAVSGHLSLPHVAVVREITSDPNAETLTVGRELEGGEVETLQVRMPALLTVQTGINQPRYATLRAIKQAHEKPLERLGLADVGLDAGQLSSAGGSRTRALVLPGKEARAQMLDGSPAEIAARIMEIVTDRLAA